MIAYLDTSSIAKLYISEQGSAEVRELVDQATLVATSQVAYPEMRAALARRRRDRTLRPRDFTTARRAFEADWPGFVAIHAAPAVCREAGDLAERYRLRGCDSIHLASFADVMRGAPAADVQFSSFDTRLNAAARALMRAARRQS